LSKLIEEGDNFSGGNEQTGEALKHIDTALLANPDIEIRIDLPSEPVLSINESVTQAMFRRIH
jgi:hypothetical protein